MLYMTFSVWPRINSNPEVVNRFRSHTGTKLLTRLLKTVQLKAISIQWETDYKLYENWWWKISWKRVQVVEIQLPIDSNKYANTFRKRSHLNLCKIIKKD